MIVQQNLRRLIDFLDEYEIQPEDVIDASANRYACHLQLTEEAFHELVDSMESGHDVRSDIPGSRYEFLRVGDIEVCTFVESK